MPIHRTADFIETYRAKARAGDINELSGRTGRPDLTDFVARRMAARLPVHADTVLVDVGCGDGRFLLRCAEAGLDGFKGRLIGLLPTREEVSRVRGHLLDEAACRGRLVSVEPGLAQRTGLPGDFADLLVCNGVLLVLQDVGEVSCALAEFHRITKPGGIVFIGELPDTDEMAGRDYGDSISGWLAWVLRNQGAAACWARARQVLNASFSREPFVIGPKRIFHMPPGPFIEMLERQGLELVACHRHEEIDAAGQVHESRTRWDYIARKTPVPVLQRH